MRLLRPGCRVDVPVSLPGWEMWCIDADGLVRAYPNPTCSGSNVVVVPGDGACFGFGNGGKIRAWRVSGTCPGFQS